MLGDSADGLKSTDLIFHDDNPEHIDANTDDGAIHRQVDLNILRHAKKWYAENGKGKGDTQIRIAVPPLIFGKGSGPFKDFSVQLPSMIRAGKALGYPVVHGEVRLFLPGSGNQGMSADGVVPHNHRARISPHTSTFSIWPRATPSFW